MKISRIWRLKTRFSWMAASMFPFLGWILGVKLRQCEMTGGENCGCARDIGSCFVSSPAFTLFSGIKVTNQCTLISILWKSNQRKSWLLSLHPKLQIALSESGQGWNTCHQGGGGIVEIRGIWCIPSLKEISCLHREAETVVQQGALSTHKWSLWHRTGSIPAKMLSPR